jgi:hypothetical protein
MTKPSASKQPPRLSLKGVRKTSNSSSSTPPTREKVIYSAANFPLFIVFRNDFMKRHPGVVEFLGLQPMQNFDQLLEKMFFEWLNYRKNAQKMVYAIRHEFMSIAEAVLLFELGNHQRRLTPFGFVIGPFQKILEQMAEEDSPSNFGVIPYSRPLCSPPISKLDETKLQIRKDELMLSGVQTFENDGAIVLEDVSQFFT